MLVFHADLMVFHGDLMVVFYGDLMELDGIEPRWSRTRASLPWQCVAPHKLVVWMWDIFDMTRMIEFTKKFGVKSQI